MTWFRELTPAERRTFWACFSGWALDAMDTQMYALAIPALLVLWNLTAADTGMLGAAVLITAAAGGSAAGIAADRFGRVRVLQLTILWFSAFTFLSGLTTSFGQLLAARSLQGLGFGGEWAVGAVLISETIEPRLRGRVVGAIQAGWAVGYGAAVLLSTLLFTLLPAQYAWRVFFLAGVLPSIFVLWIRRNVEDPPLYTRQGAVVSRPRVWTIFSGPNVATTMKALLLTTGIYGGNYVMITWLPAYLRLVLGLSVLNAGAYLAVNIIGTFCGAFLNGWLADRVGRRRTFVICACTQAATVAIYTLAPISAAATFLLGFVLGTMQSGTAAGTGAFLAELFPTAIRATAQGFCGNAGRALGALAPAVVGYLTTSRWSLGGAMAVCASVAYTLVVIFAMALPETRGRDLGTIPQVDNRAGTSWAITEEAS